MALEVRCRRCGSGPGEPCLTPAWPGKGPKSRRLLRFTPAHDSRIRDAAAARGYSEAEADRIANLALTEGTGVYRKTHPAVDPGPEPAQQELALE
jgi:hypothetical protein